MELKAVTISNFRGYKNPVTVPIYSTVTGIVGRNDVGKSSILEALDIFFDGGEITLDKDDFNIESPDTEVTITCTFINLPSEIVIDESNKTTLAAEHLLNQNQELQIRKKYKKSTTAKPTVSLVALHPSGEKYSDLHALKINDLKKRAAELGIAATAVPDARVSALWRSAIWSHVGNTQNAEMELDISKFVGDSKNIQDKIFSLLPIFALFRSDRESKDSDSEAKNPLQEAVKQAQRELKEQIEAIQNQIQQKVFERADQTLKKLSEMDPTLATKLKPRFKKQPSWTCDFSLDDDEGVPINKRGSGVRRLILLNFFRAEAERKVQEKNAPSVIYAFEEPETSQHPANQEMLIKSLIQLGNNIACQILVTTHVPALAGFLPLDGLRLVDNSSGEPKIKFGEDIVFTEICDTLGILPEFNSKAAQALVLVEGPSDITFLKQSAEKLKAAGHISATLDEKRIYVITIGGCENLKHWITKQIADQFQIPWGVLLDSDKGTPKEIKKIEEISKLRKQGKKAYLTRKREPENYILPAVANSLATEGVTVEYSDADDAKAIISAALRIRDSHVLDRLWPAMTAEQIRASEKYLDDQLNERYELTEMLTDFLSMA